VASELQAELKQHKPFRSLKEEATLSIWRTAALPGTCVRIRRSSHIASPAHSTTCCAFSAARNPTGCVATRLARGLVRQAPDVTRLLDRLEDSKLIARERGGDDRRFVLTRITRAGLGFSTMSKSESIKFTTLSLDI
jgi:hypothetical protein